MTPFTQVASVAAPLPETDIDTDIIFPAENRQNVEEDLTQEQLTGVTLHYVKTIDELLRIALPTSRAEEKKDAEVREQVLQTVPVG